MSSIRIINRATESFQGTGLPFYENQSDAFSYQSEQFNSDIGLWRVPTNKPPTFQLFIDRDLTNLVSFIWYETRGNGDFTGTTQNYTFYINQTNVTVNGNIKTIYQTSDSSILVPVAPETRWQAALTVQDNEIFDPNIVTFWSEEFITSDCC